jgi:hypothetical protein
VSRRPAAPPGQRAEIALACQFLCSPQASIISGATLVADGGASALMSRRWHLLNVLIQQGSHMTSEAVFIQVGALADGFAPHGNVLPVASCPAETLTFYLADGARHQLTIEDDHALLWDGQPFPGA